MAKLANLEKVLQNAAKKPPTLAPARAQVMAATRRAGQKLARGGVRARGAVTPSAKGYRVQMAVPARVAPQARALLRSELDKEIPMITKRVQDEAREVLKP